MQTQLLITALPEGYTVRPTTMDDAEAALHLANLVSLAEIGAAEYELNEFVRYWQSPHHNLETDSRLIHDPDGVLVATCDVWMVRQPPVRVHVEVLVQPNHPHARDFYAYLLTWGEAEAHRAIPLCPEGAEVVMTGGTHITNSLGLAMHQAHGMTYKRTFYMMQGKLDVPPATPTWPDSVTVRAMLGPEEGRTCYAAIEDMFSGHYSHIPDPELQNYPEWAQRHIEIPEFDPSLWFVAEVEGEIVGMIWCRRSMPEDENMGYINIIGVRADWRKRGLGLALLHHGFGELYRRGATRVGLHADAANNSGATRLYERVGMWAERVWHSYEKELRPGVVLYAR